ncbi:MAG: DUF4412 domain-containing protein [Bacteroidota bacterium]|nr:DUF4412 domain-containing protein [Bacteroidota bacterium]
MPGKILFLLFSFFMLSGISVAQFEGVMEMKTVLYDEGRSEEILYTMIIKKNLIMTRIKNPAKEKQEGSFIFRGDKQLLWVINDEDKSYLEISTKDEGKPTKSIVSDSIGKSKLSVKQTGKKETMLGYECVEVIIEGENEEINIWGTKKFGNFYEDLMKSFGDITGRGDVEFDVTWENELSKLKLFPLKIVIKENGNIVQQQEVMKISAKNIPLSTFQVPKGYKKEKIDFNIEKMMKEMELQMKNEQLDTSDDGENEK